MVWSVDEGAAIVPRRPQDRSLVANVVQAMAAYGQERLGPVTLPLSTVDRIIAIGSDRMMNAVREARASVLRDLIRPEAIVIGSINSPMQCMLKEVCSQCLQRHVDPVSGQDSLVFSCFNQDQALDQVDFGFLAGRLRQNSAAEKLTSLWLDTCSSSGRSRRSRNRGRDQGALSGLDRAAALRYSPIDIDRRGSCPPTSSTS